MDELKPFSVGTDEGSWRTQGFRQNVVAKIYEFIQKSGMTTNRNSIEMENHVYLKAKTKEEYLSMVARLILHFRDINLKKTGVGTNAQGVLPNGPGGNQPNNVGGPSNQNVSVSNQPGTPNNANVQGQMQVPQNPMGAPSNQVGGIQGQMVPQSTMNQQGPPQQNPPITTNLLQSLNQRPQLSNMQQLQNKMGPGMGLMANQAAMSANNMAPNQMNSQVVNQMNQNQMQGQMPNPNMGPNPMGNQMAGNNPMANQMMQNSMNPNMPGQMVVPNQMGNQLGNLSGNQLNMMHIQQRKPGECMTNMMGANPASFQTGGPRSNAPGQFLRQSPSPSAPSPATMGGPSPASIGVMAGPMPSPMSVGSGGLGVGSGVPIGGVASPALAPSPSSHHSMQQHSQQHSQPHPRSVGMVQSPSSSLNTPIGAGAAPSPVGGSGDDHAYREKVRQLSKYIEPLRKMIERMVNDGENVEKMKKLLEILSHPTKRMPLETLLKCEAVLEKLDFKRNERQSLHSQSNPLLHGIKEHQIFSPLLEVVNNCLQSSVASHTLERTFGPCVEALCGPEIRHMPPPLKKQKIEEPTPDIPDILQGEIARLDSRFKVSLEGFQAGTGTGAIRLVAQLEDSRLPCVPPVSLSVPRDYPASPPTCLLSPGHYSATPFLQRIGEALSVRLSALPRLFSLSQLLDTWEMSVRQACNPNYSMSNQTAILISSI